MNYETRRGIVIGILMGAKVDFFTYQLQSKVKAYLVTYFGINEFSDKTRHRSWRGCCYSGSLHKVIVILSSKLEPMNGTKQDSVTVDHIAAKVHFVL